MSSLSKHVSNFTCNFLSVPPTIAELFYLSIFSFVYRNLCCGYIRIVEFFLWEVQFFSSVLDAAVLQQLCCFFFSRQSQICCKNSVTPFCPHAVREPTECTSMHVHIYSSSFQRMSFAWVFLHKFSIKTEWVLEKLRKM